MSQCLAYLWIWIWMGFFGQTLAANRWTLYLHPHSMKCFSFKFHPYFWLNFNLCCLSWNYKKMCIRISWVCDAVTHFCMCEIRCGNVGNYALGFFFKQTHQIQIFAQLLLNKWAGILKWKMTSYHFFFCLTSLRSSSTPFPSRLCCTKMSSWVTAAPSWKICSSAQITNTCTLSPINR